MMVFLGVWGESRERKLQRQRTLQSNQFSIGFNQNNIYDSLYNKALCLVMPQQFFRPFLLTKNGHYHN
jgi:hypothetical protein